MELETHHLGLVLAERYGFSIYDATILAAAQRANCRVVFTEDLQHGRVIDVRRKIIDPFSMGLIDLAHVINTRRALPRLHLYRLS